ncbi:MATE family efflux transporter [Romboutsia hominis]|uniref:MATE family efflux transporter n=1 Tax=Romboutsia hominis TaxID=1507512 RepID=UPI001F05ED02|nr:MATE family efflux transporter [Romboutsia hominis]MCH1960026.1 MATE family efflux transporter [Romboutsia hominis]MCH1969545.1 MATE family efflux transporter [Romboutsia hominis]
MHSQTELGVKHVNSLLFKYSVPAIIGMLVNALYNVIDRMFIGKIPGVGPLAITGLGITMPIATIILAFGMLIGIGTTTNISIKLGQKKNYEAEVLLGNAVTLSLIIGIILTIIGIIFSEDILILFGASENTLIYAKTYIDIILVGSVVNLLSFSLYHSIRADGNPRISSGIMILGCILNASLDYLFIFIFNLGIQGAALATIIAQCVTAILTILYYLSKKSNLKIRKNNLILRKDLVVSTFAIGMSPFFMQLAASLVQVISNNALRTYGGDLAIGAMTTISSIAMIFLMPIFGLNQGAQPIIGYNYGAKKYNRVKKAYLMSLSVATIILFIGTFFIQMYPKFFIGLFNKDEELMKISIQGIRIYLFMMPIVGISITGSNFIQSIGKAKIAMLLSLLRQVILLIPFILILPQFLGLNGVWLSQALADLISTILTIIVLYKELRSYKILNDEGKDILKAELEEYALEKESDKDEK